MRGAIAGENLDGAGTRAKGVDGHGPAFDGVALPLAFDPHLCFHHPGEGVHGGGGGAGWWRKRPDNDKNATSNGEFLALLAIAGVIVGSGHWVISKTVDSFQRSDARVAAVEALADFKTRELCPRSVRR